MIGLGLRHYEAPGSLEGMDKRYATAEDQKLVTECLAGSERAWRELYSRFVALMRSVVKRHTGLQTEDVQDITQSAFLSLTTALRNYDHKHPLPAFVCMVAERVAIDEYRKLKAAKRDAETESVDHHDGGDEGARMIRSDCELQDDEIARLEEIARLREALERLDRGCRDLIKLRYYKELSFGEIAGIMGETENTVTVRTRRCLDKLRTVCLDSERKGTRR